MTHKAIKTLELKGLECPHTFVRTKLVMETLSPGQQLRVIVDNPIAKIDLPKSAQQHGYLVIAVEALSAGSWAITLETAP